MAVMMRTMLEVADNSGARKLSCILPRGGDHTREWTEACKGNGKTFSSFAIGGPLTELMQLINVSTLFEEALQYDTISGRIINSRAANEMLHRKYRKGWSL